MTIIQWMAFGFSQRRKVAGLVLGAGGILGLVCSLLLAALFSEKVNAATYRTCRYVQQSDRKLVKGGEPVVFPHDVTTGFAIIRKTTIPLWVIWHKDGTVTRTLPITVEGRQIGHPILRKVAIDAVQKNWQFGPPPNGCATTIVEVQIVPQPGHGIEGR